MPPPLSKCEILILESSEHTDDRIHFTEVIETVSDVPRCIWDPLTRNSGLRSDHETTKSMVRLQKLCGDVCLGTLSGIALKRDFGVSDALLT